MTPHRTCCYTILEECQLILTQGSSPIKYYMIIIMIDTLHKNLESEKTYWLDNNISTMIVSFSNNK